MPRMHCWHGLFSSSVYAYSKRICDEPMPAFLSHFTRRKNTCRTIGKNVGWLLQERMTNTKQRLEALVASFRATPLRQPDGVLRPHRLLPALDSGVADARAPCISTTALICSAHPSSSTACCLSPLRFHDASRVSAKPTSWPSLGNAV